MQKYPTQTDFGKYTKAYGLFKCKTNGESKNKKGLQLFREAWVPHCHFFSKSLQCDLMNLVFFGESGKRLATV